MRRQSLLRPARHVEWSWWWIRRVRRKSGAVGRQRIGGAALVQRQRVERRVSSNRIAGEGAAQSGAARVVADSDADECRGAGDEQSARILHLDGHGWRDRRACIRVRWLRNDGELGGWAGDDGRIRRGIVGWVGVTAT